MDGRDRHCGGLGTFGVRLSRWLVLWLMVLTTEHTEHTEIFNLFFLSGLRDLRGELHWETK
jgi:hypothetical protein